MDQQNPYNIDPYGVSQPTTDASIPANAQFASFFPGQVVPEDVVPMPYGFAVSGHDRNISVGHPASIECFGCPFLHSTGATTSRVLARHLLAFLRISFLVDMTYSTL